MPSWLFRLRDSGFFDIVSGAGYFVLALGFLVLALIAEADVGRVLFFVLSVATAGGGTLLIWNAGRVGALDDEPPKDG